ncbi:Hypothetical_protein [Hexamita inflata]|uniref:Hypothetical_protein n=1 Tax=Hexamita inflata TaxID=28002 RepID=A0AA86PDH3_9EUKA|nr:Hypothetical protein HINF_LOCUS24694 [Hexamita inflata]
MKRLYTSELQRPRTKSMLRKPLQILQNNNPLFMKTQTESDLEKSMKLSPVDQQNVDELRDQLFIQRNQLLELYIKLYQVQEQIDSKIRSNDELLQTQLNQMVTVYKSQKEEQLNKINQLNK